MGRSFERLARDNCRQIRGGPIDPYQNERSPADLIFYSIMHFYLNWTKERIDEMDATLASLEAKAGQVQADAKVKANHLIADLKKLRDEFEATAKAQAEAGEAAWQRTKTQLESQWNVFEAQVPSASRSSSNRPHSETLPPLR
jgi:uncharacterized phage infection (PIP) family protein YhgE